MNYTADVAKILGVELGEEFKLSDYPETFILTERGLEFLYHGKWSLISGSLNDLLSGRRNIIKMPKPILDKTEKKYLSYVIKPFRKDVLKIAKFESITSEYKEIISVKTKNGNMIFPAFEKGKMYKNMELNKDYSLKELGL